MEEYRDHRVEWQPALRVVLLFLAAGSLALSAGIHFYAPGEDARSAAPLLMALFAALSLLAYQAGRIELGRSILTYGVLSVVALSMAFSGGMRSAAMLVFAPLIITASVISPRTGRKVVLLSSLLLLAMGLAEYLRWLPAVSPMPWGMYLLLNAIILLVAAGIGRYLNILLHARTDWERSISTQLTLEKATLAAREQQLGEKNAFQDALMQAQSDAGLAMFIIEAGRVVYANDAACRIYGYSQEEMRALPSYLELAHPDNREWIAQNHQRRMRGEKFENNYRISIVTKAGERREADLTAAYMPGPVPRVLVILADATERMRAERALQESEARLREAQRIGRVGSWELDLASRRMTWSNELYRIYAREPGSFGGSWQALLDLVYPDDVPKMREVWQQAANVTGNIELRHRILTPDGRTKHLHVRFEVFRDGDGRPLRAIGTAQDITEQVLAKAEIERLNEKLEARVRERTAELQSANKELESFAYSISHDLRAPLRGIDGFGQLLLEEYGGRLDAQGQDYLKRMRGAAQRMGTLIDDILELSRVTRKSMGRERVDLSRMAADILDNKAKSEPQRKVETSLMPDCAATGDAQLLRILMENLIENAWKYSRHADPARIEFGAERIDGETAYFVRDNGVGFDMKYAGRLFGPFQRLHKPEEFEGTGIGLASAARVVHRHGGRIWAEAEPGKGATFRFTLAQSGVPAGG